MATTLFFPAAIWVDNISLTDQGRAPVTRAREERSVVSETATGTKRKYFKAIKSTFSMSWTWLPDNADKTIDGGAARSGMVDLLSDSEVVHTLRFYDVNGGYKEYQVWVESYSEELIKRDPVSGQHIWNISVSFTEQ